MLIDSRDEVYFLLKLKDKSGDVVKVQKMPKLPTLGVAWLRPYEFGQLKPPKFSIVLYYTSKIRHFGCYISSG